MLVRAALRVAAIMSATALTACKIEILGDAEPPGHPCQPEDRRLALAAPDEAIEVGRGQRLNLVFAGQWCDTLVVASSDSLVMRATLSGLGGWGVFVSGVAPGVAMATVSVGGQQRRASVTVGPIREDFSTLSGTCALTESLDAYCWNNGNPVPAHVLGMKLSQVVTGWITCGLAALDGNAVCWSLISEPWAPRVATRLPGGLSFEALSAGGADVCGLTAGGAAYCWGGSSVGGGGYSPHAVSGDLELTTLAVGKADLAQHAHACGLDIDGAAYCWGDNTYGQLGVAGGSSQSPVPVSGGFRFTSLTAGAAFTCGVTTDSLAYCWGAAGLGQLGDSGSVTTICDGEYYNQCSSTPVRVVGGLKFTALSAGGWHVCALLESGVAYCWGDQGYGQLGAGYNVSGCGTSCGFPVPVAAGLTFRSLASDVVSTCAQSADLIIYCWGTEALGTGSSGPSFFPLRVSGQR